ncbi:MAG: hypothetical protein KKA79_02505 [Nanoarchaeota archaeon]|nr:hypothetical protein [Nanoarchaeota archaeon]MCG2718198.1 hypothetical protein [Nanoarchaeota archaeon]
MKLPNTFRPQKNLDDKTEELIEEANINRVDSPNINQELLDSVLANYDNNHLGYLDINIHPAVDILLGQADYKPIPGRFKYQFWSKQDPLYKLGSYVFIRKNNHLNNKSYCFARTDTENLEKFCKVFESHSDIDKKQNWLHSDRFGKKVKAYMLTGGIIFGGVTAIAASSYLFGMPLVAFAQCQSFLLGSSLGACKWVMFSDYALKGVRKIGDKIYDKEHDDMGYLSEEIVKDNKGALIRAFT